MKMVLINPMIGLRISCNSLLLIYICLLLLFSLLLIISHETVGEGDEVYFFSSNDEQKRITDIYEGENEVYLMVYYKSHCNNWSVIITTDLFRNNNLGPFPEEIKSGTWQTHPLLINPLVPFGEYNFFVYHNYTFDDGELVSNQYSFEINYMNIIDFSNIQLPNQDRNVFLFTVIIFQTISDLDIRIDTDGDIISDPKVISINRLAPGEYSYSTLILPDPSISDSREVRIDFDFIIDEREISIASDTFTINPNINFVESTNYETIEFDAKIIALIISILAVTILFNYFYYIKK